MSTVGKTSMLIHRIHDTTIGVLGLLLNVLLVYVAIKKTQPTFRKFAHLVLLSASIDILYVFLQLLCQHQHEVKNAQFFFMANGIERFVSERTSYIISTIQMTIALMSVTILPVQFYYRFLLVFSTHPPSILVLFGLTGIAFVVSSTMGVLGTLSHIQAAARGRQYYVDQLSAVWNDARGESRFISAIDLKDSVSLIYYSFGSSVIAFSYGVSLLYGYKCIKFVQPLNGAEQQSARTVALRKQFTRNLIVQACCSYLCSVVPTGFVALISVLHIDASGYFIWFATVIAWGPLLNAAIPLSIIRPYRSFILNSLGLEKISAKLGDVQSTAGTVAQKTAPSQTFSTHSNKSTDS